MGIRPLTGLAHCGLVAFLLAGPAAAQESDPGSIEFRASGTPGVNTIYVTGDRRESASGLLTLEVWANEVTDLYGVAFSLQFPQALVRFPKSRPTVFAEGPFLGEEGAVPTALLVEQVGQNLVVGLSRIGEEPGVSGSGLLMTLEFKGLGVGGRKQLRLRDRTAFDSMGQAIEDASWLAGKIIATAPQ